MVLSINITPESPGVVAACMSLHAIAILIIASCLLAIEDAKYMIEDLGDNIDSQNAVAGDTYSLRLYCL